MFAHGLKKKAIRMWKAFGKSSVRVGSHLSCGWKQKRVSPSLIPFLLTPQTFSIAGFKKHSSNDGLARAGKTKTSRNWLAYILIFKWVMKDLSHKDPQCYQLQQPPGI